MKILRLFDSLKFVVAAIVCTFILNVAHAATTAIQSVIAYGKTEQNGTPTPTSPVPIMTNNGVLKVSPNLFDKNTITVGYYYSPSGVYSTTSDGMVSNWIPISSNTTLTLTATIPAGGTNGSNRRVNYFDANKNWLSQTVSPVGGNNPIYTFTTPENTKYIRISWSYNGTYALDTDHAQLELGSTATAYMPYGTVYADDMVETIRDAAGNKATTQMLLSVGDYKDEQNITTGAITRRVGVKVLDGTEDWRKNTALADTRNAFSSSLDFVPQSKVSYCTHLPNVTSTNLDGVYLGVGMNFILGSSSNITTAEQFKQWLAEQYANGTPVIVVYPLATETTESVAAQSLTTAPVRQTLGAIMDMPIKTILTDNTEIMSGAEELIKIATTKYNEESFEDVQDALTGVFNAVDTVVSQTMTQAQAIDTIATTKQTRPDETCPPFKKCLLVEDEDGTPHWYEIYDPINDFLRPILAAAGLSGNQGAPVMRTHTCTGTGGEPASGTCYDEFNGFYMGSNVFRQKYYGLNTTYNRPFGPTTLARCAENAPRTTSTKEAGICYNTGGMFRELTNDSDNYVGEWALVWNGNEGGNSLGITPGVVYGVAKCTSVGQHATEMTGDVVDGSNYWWPKKLNNYSTTLASLISDYPNSNVETVFNTLPNPVGTDEKPGYPRENFRNCWCKMTAIGVPGSGENDDQRYANGSIMSVSGDWIFNHVRTSGTDCANTCTYYCAYYFSVIASYRRTVLTVK